MVSYGFYNAINYDRLYDAMQLSQIFDGVINDGIFAHYGEAFEVSPGGGLSIIVGTGRCWFNHTWTLNDADIPMLLEPAEMVLDRIDAVVIEIDARDSVRENHIKIVKGTPGSPAEKPTLTNDDLVHQHAIAYISVPAGSTEIDQGSITDNRGQEDCHFADALLDVIDVTELMKKWTYQFYKWFGNIKNTVDKYLEIYKGSLKAGESVIVFTDLEQVTEGLEDTMPDLAYLKKNKMGEQIQITTGDHWLGSDNKIYKRVGVSENWTIADVDLADNLNWEVINDPDTKISNESVMSFYSSVWGVEPKAVDVYDGAVRLIFEPYKDDLDVAVSIDG